MAGLKTDLYALTMVQAFYLLGRREDEVCFDYFFRKYPYPSSFVVFAGIQTVLEEIEELYFSPEDILYLNSLGSFKKEFLDYLSLFRFTGTIYSLEEGSLAFEQEVMVRVQGNLLEVLLIEALLLNSLNFQTLIATYAAHLHMLLPQKAFYEFGLRRAQGEAAILASRAAFIGGARASSYVEAGKRWKIPIFGTMSHAWILAFKTELEAFERFAEIYPENCTLLIDTYDTLESGLVYAVLVFKKLQKTHPKGERAVRIDSGDLSELSFRARLYLDEQGCKEVRIVVSNELDWDKIKFLEEKKVPIDGYGIGTHLVTGGIQSALSGVFKMAQISSPLRMRNTVKYSEQEKKNLPGIKGIARFVFSDFYQDVLFLEEAQQELEQEILNVASENNTTGFLAYTLKGERIFLKGYQKCFFPLKEAMRSGKRMRGLQNPPGNFFERSLCEIQSYFFSQSSYLGASSFSEGILVHASLYAQMLKLDLAFSHHASKINVESFAEEKSEQNTEKS